MPRRYLALWLPFLPTDRLRRERPELPRGGPADPPLVLVGRENNAFKLIDCDERAARLGLTRGLTLADARARIPALVAEPARPAVDGRFLERLADACERFTPLVALDPPHGLMLDITGCAHLFGGEDGMLALLAGWVGAAGFSRRIAVAGTPEAAHALSRFGRGGIVAPGGEAVATMNLPTEALVIPPETVTALSRAGLKTVGSLAGRPSATLSARFGEELVARLRRVLGHEDIRITPLRPLPDCMAERHFAEPLSEAGAIEAEIGGLIAAVAGDLERSGTGGRRFEAALFRTDGMVRRLAIETGRPVRDAGVVLRLWRERVETLADPLDPGFGFDAIRLTVPVCEPLAQRQEQLSRREVEDEALADLVDRLSVRFGSERVLRLAVRDTHDPRRQARLLRASGGAGGETGGTRPEPGEPPGRPLYLFEPPQPIETLSEVPDGPPMRFRWRRRQHAVLHAEGPERIAPEWWREGGGPVRDYYRVEDGEGRRFWLFRAGFHEEGEPPPRWFLHGLFA